MNIVISMKSKVPKLKFKKGSFAYTTNPQKLHLLLFVVCSVQFGIKDQLMILGRFIMLQLGCFKTLFERPRTFQFEFWGKNKMFTYI